MGQNSEKLAPPPNNNPPTVSIISKLWQFLFYFILQSLPSDRKNIQALPFSFRIKTTSLPFTSFLPFTSSSFTSIPKNIHIYFLLSKNPSKYTSRNYTKDTSSMNEKICAYKDPICKMGRGLKGYRGASKYEIERGSPVAREDRQRKGTTGKVGGREKRK